MKTKSFYPFDNHSLYHEKGGKCGKFLFQVMGQFNIEYQELLFTAADAESRGDSAEF